MRSSVASRAGASASDTEARAGSSEPKPVRVLHVNCGNLYGGVESILATLARFRRECPGMESHFALCEEGRLSRELREAGAAVYLMGRARFSRPWTVWRARREMARLLERERFDLVICHMPWSLAVFGQAVIGARQRLGFWAHGFHTGQPWLERLARQTRPDLAIANSRFTERGLANLFPQSRRAVIFPPVALHRSAVDQQQRQKLREELGAAADSVVLIQVGRMEEGKGHFLQLQALSRLKGATKWMCWIAGGAQTQAEQHYVQQLEQAAAELGIAGRVRFLGQRSDVPQLLQAADLFCQPNTAPDSFGIVFVEALWAGLPVVTTAMGGAQEILDDSCGVLVEPDSLEGLAGAIEKLIENPDLRERLGRAGASRAARLCDPAAQMSKLLELAEPLGRRTP